MHRTVAKHSTYEQLHYFDTTSPYEDDNVLLCMNNATITIPDDNCEPVSISNTNDIRNITTAVPNDDECIIDYQSVQNGNTDDECVIVPLPNQSLNITKPTPKPIKVL